MPDSNDKLIGMMTVLGQPSRHEHKRPLKKTSFNEAQVACKKTSTYSRTHRRERTSFKLTALLPTRAEVCSNS